MNLPSNWSEGNSSVHCLRKPTVAPRLSPASWARSQAPQHTVPIAHEEGGARELGPRQPTQIPGASFSWKSRALGGRANTSSSRHPPAVWVSSQEGTGEGTDGDDLGLQMQLTGFRVSGLRPEHPWPRGWRLSRSPRPAPPRGAKMQGRGKSCSPSPSWPVCCSYAVTPCPPWQGHTHSARRISPAACILL